MNDGDAVEVATRVLAKSLPAMLKRMTGHKTRTIMVVVDGRRLSCCGSGMRHNELVAIMRAVVSLLERPNEKTQIEVDDQIVRPLGTKTQ